jgi:hypothetical protein
MPIKSFKMGDGTFKLGTGGTQDASCQVTNLRVTPSENVQTADAVPVLCGEELPQEDTVTVTWQLAGNVVQDIAATDLVAYTWTNASEVVDFEFVPNTVAARKVTGQCRIVPLELGGDVKSRPQSDFTWAIIGTPVLGNTP